MNLKYKYIVWDWNGTLLDDISASLASVNDMLIKRNMDIIDIVRYKECIGVPIICFYEQVFDLEKEEYEDLLREYNEGYNKHLKNCSLADGARELLEKFRSDNVIQLIVSSANNIILKENIEKFGVSEYFDAALGSDNFFAESKIQRAVEYINKKGKGDILVIGDLAHDYEMAQELSADCILTKTGHENPKVLAKCNCKIVENLREIIDNS